MSAKQGQPERDGPWTEQDWERFMRQADMRTARYHELVETVIDEPDFQEILDREMGWRREGCTEELRPSCAHEEFAPEPGENENVHVVPGNPVEFFEAQDRDLGSIPAYRLALTLAESLHKALAPLIQGIDAVGAEGDLTDQDEDLSQANRQILIVAARIAAGHAMGYEDQVVGGNLVNCKRSLSAAGECAAAIDSLKRRSVLPEPAAISLLGEIGMLQGELQKRVAELRQRMWWDSGKV